MLIISSLSTTAQTTLAAGDIAIVGYDFSYNTTTTAPIGNDNFNIVVLKSIAAGTVINFTSNGWTGSAFTSTGTIDGFFTWTVSSAIMAGDVFNFSIANGTLPATVTVTPSNGTISGVTSTEFTSTVGFSPSTGNQILIFQGTQGSPTFIYGINTNATNVGTTGWVTGTVGNNAAQSALPTGLTNANPFNGTVSAPTALPFTLETARYNAVYTGILVGSQGALLTAIGNYANWTATATATAPYNLSVGGTYFTTSNPVFSLSTLPVDWLNFTVKQAANSYSWDWSVAQVENVAYYIPQYSIDGTNFTDAGMVTALTNNNTYQFSKSFSQSSNIFFRVKEVDVDGNASYSETHLFNSALVNTFSFYPNPAKSELIIQWPYENAVSVNTSILSSDGKIVKQQTNAMASTIKIALTGLLPGMYFISCSDDKQHKPTVQAFVKATE